MTTEKPLISIIIPIYDVERYLERCVKSVLSQTYQNLEIILVDDGTPDNAGIMADNFAKADSRIKVIHQKNAGLGAARNTGIRNATGKYIAFVDSDDWIAPDMIEYLYRLISKYDADYSAIDCIITSNKSENPIQPEEEIKTLNKKEMYDLFFRISSDDINYCVWDKLYKTEIIRQISFVEGKRFEDIDYCYKVIKLCNKAVVSNRICYFYFRNTLGITLGELKHADFDLLDIWKIIVSDCDSNLPEYEEYARYNYIRAHFGLIGKAAKCGVSEKFTDWAQRKKELISVLRKNKRFLLRGNLPLSRKVALVLCCINPVFLEVTYKLFRKNKKFETKC